MFSCLSNPIQIKIPTHLSIIPEMAWLHNTAKLDSIFQWCLDRNVKQLSFFAVPLNFWENTNIELFSNFILNYTPPEGVDMDIVSSMESKLSVDIRLKCHSMKNTQDSRLKVYLFTAYSFHQDLNHIEYASQIKQTGSIPSSMSDPDLLIFTGGLTKLHDFCMLHLINTCLLWSPTPFSCIDHEVLDDLIEIYSERI